VSDLRPTRRFGDAAVVADLDTSRDALRLASAATAASWEGVEEVVVGHRSLTVVADPRVTDLEEIEAALRAMPLGSERSRSPRVVEIPTAFDGPDLSEVASLCAMTQPQVVRALTESKLEAAFSGFSPGFAYLSGLPEALAALPRRGDPRTTVEAGSVALAGGFAAIYPGRSPGGWHVVGRTSLRLFDPETPPFALIQPGDLVRLVPVSHVPQPEDPPARAPLRSRSSRCAEVERPGFLSLVEDSGRRGLASLGVPRAGGADPTSLRLSNRLVGNDEGAAAIEVTGLGPTFRMLSVAHVAVVGDVEVRIDERDVLSNTVLPLEAGQNLGVGSVRTGFRAYIAFGGGVEVPTVMGSRSSDTLCALGCGALRRQDVIGLGPKTRPRGRLSGPSPSLPEHGTSELRVILGPDAFDEEQVALLESTTWEVGANSDRVGVRLQGGRIRPPSEGIASRATVTGAVQVPASGSPIALLCDHATVGGYPVVATVVSADIGKLGQLPPGAAVRFRIVDLAEARAALGASERSLEAQVSGWYPDRSD